MNKESGKDTSGSKENPERSNQDQPAAENEIKKPEPVNEKQMINVTTTAAMFGISPKTLRTWCKRGLISYYYTPHNHRRFKLTEVQEFLEKIHVVPKKPR